MVEEYIKAGKCRRNIEGKIVLSTGAWIPQDILGNNFKERINEWHNCNPNQLTTATLLNAIIRPTTAPAPMPMVTIGKPVTTSYQLSVTDCIAALEAKLFTLKAQKPAFASTPCTRAQKARAAEMRDKEDKAAVTAAQNQKEPRIVEITEDENETPTPAAKSTAPTSAAPTKIILTLQPMITTMTRAPEHPYKIAKDIACIPPTARNIGAIEKGAPKKTEPAYKTLPPVYNAAVAAKVYKRSMETPVTLTQEELLSLSPEICSLVRDITTTHCIHNKDFVTNHSIMQSKK